MESKKHVFTTLEKKYFMDIIKKFSRLIENKDTDGASLRNKNEAWNKVTAEFNASPLTTSQATHKQLRRLWMNLKQRQREALTKERQHRLATGGGPSTSDADIDPDVSIVAPALLVGIDTAIDSDTIHETTVPKCPIVHKKETFVGHETVITPEPPFTPENTIYEIEVIDEQPIPVISTLPTSTLLPFTLPPSTLPPSTHSPVTLTPTIPPATLSPSTLTPSTLPPSTLPPSTLPPSTLPPSTSRSRPSHQTQQSAQWSKIDVIAKEYKDRLKRANEKHEAELLILREKHTLEMLILQEQRRETKAKADLAELNLKQKKNLQDKTPE